MKAKKFLVSLVVFLVLVSMARALLTDIPTSGPGLTMTPTSSPAPTSTSTPTATPAPTPHPAAAPSPTKAPTRARSSDPMSEIWEIEATVEALEREMGIPGFEVPDFVPDLGW